MWIAIIIGVLTLLWVGAILLLVGCSGSAPKFQIPDDERVEHPSEFTKIEAPQENTNKRNSKLFMKHLLLILIALTFVAVGCNNKQTSQSQQSTETISKEDREKKDKIFRKQTFEKFLNTEDSIALESDKTHLDSIFVSDFYKSIKRISIDAAEPMIDRDILMIDSTYFFEYTSQINGYIVKGIVRDLQQISNINYIGEADLWFSDSIQTRYILHLTFSLPDSVVVQLKTRKVNQLEYNLIHNENNNANELRQFSNVPFSFFDVDFDGEKELLLRHIFVRGTYEYTPYFASDSTYDEFFVKPYIDSPISESDEISYPLVLDDLTQFDVNNKEIITNLLVGWNDNLKIYYKVAKRTAILYKIETFDKQWERLIKRTIYTDEGSIIEQFE